MSTGHLPGLHGRGVSASGQGQSSFRSESMAETSTTTSGPHQSIAPPNEGLMGWQNDPANPETWDFWHYYWLKLWVLIQHYHNREVVKSIHANPAVLRTYHDSFLFGEVPLSVKARSALRAGTSGFSWNLVEFMLALLSGALYVYSTYEPQSNWVFRVQNVISFAFVADYILRVYCEPVRLDFIFSVWGFVELLSALPIILVFDQHTGDAASLLQLFQFVRLVRIFSFRNVWSYFGSSVAHQIMILSISTFGAIFLDAGLVQWVEYHWASPSLRATCSPQGCLTFWQSFYFVIVTVSTVGYGDIVITTVVGQLVPVLTIIAALTILPIQIGRITELAYRRPYGGSFSSTSILPSRFLIISGSIRVQAVESCLSEFYNPTHSEDLEAYPLRVIILAPFSPSYELKQILTLYNGLVKFMEGSPVRQSDLERVSADQAAAIILLADEEADNHQVEDSAQILRALAIDRFCQNSTRIQRKVRIITEVLDPETQRSSIWKEADRRTIEVVCIATVHYRLLARSCIVNGLYTLITNLFTSELPLRYMNEKHFLSEYFHSFDNEIYPVILPRAFDGLEFEEVAEFIFNTFSSVLLGLDIQIGFKRDGQPDRRVLLYPKGHKIGPEDVGLLIASDLHTAYAISSYTPKEDHAGSVLHQFWARAKTTSTLSRRTKGIELVHPTGDQWKRSNSTIPTGPQLGFQNYAFGEEGPPSYQSDGAYHSDGNRKLEYQLRSAIQNVYSTEQYPSWRKNDPHALEMGIAQGPDYETFEFEPNSEESTGPAAEARHRFLKGTSLEKAIEELLVWPPVSFRERPHPRLIEEKEDAIMKDLKERTINIVYFNVPHILVCCHSGWPKHFFYFVRELRKPGRHNPPIVMLYPDQVTSRQWGSVGVFKDVYFIRGSAVHELDLLRAGVLQAETIVILSEKSVPVDLGGKDGVETPAAYTSDVQNVIVSANVRRLYGNQCPPDGILVEVKSIEAMFYFLPRYEIPRAHFPLESFRRNRKAIVHFTPPFMEGKVVSSSMLGFLMRASFYNRNTSSIVEQLILGGNVRTSTGISKDRPRTLVLFNVPEQYGNKPYCDLFLGLLKDKEMLAIGLYRAKDTLGAPTAYVLTNPKPDYIVNPEDRVYVIQ